MNKISFGILPKPAIFLAGDETLTFSQVMRRAHLYTTFLRSGCIFVAYKVLRNLLKKSIL